MQHLSKSVEKALLKTLLKETRGPCVPPIHNNNRCVADLKGKFQLFSFYFFPYLKNALSWKMLVYCPRHVPNMRITLQISIFFQKKIYLR